MPEIPIKLIDIESLEKRVKRDLWEKEKGQLKLVQFVEKRDRDTIRVRRE